MTIQDLATHPASYVSVSELATYWEVSRRQVYKHIDSGMLPAMRLGPRCYRIRTSSAAEFEQRVSAAPLKVTPPRPVPAQRMRAVPMPVERDQEAQEP